MNFSEMLIMCGPAGVECDHSRYMPKDTSKESPMNNHWMINSGGSVIVRGGDFDSDYEILSNEAYENGASTPHLLSVDGGVIVPANLTPYDISSNWKVLEYEEVQKLFA